VQLGRRVTKPQCSFVYLAAAPVERARMEDEDDDEELVAAGAAAEADAAAEGSSETSTPPSPSLSPSSSPSPSEEEVEDEEEEEAAGEEAVHRAGAGAAGDAAGAAAAPPRQQAEHAPECGACKCAVDTEDYMQCNHCRTALCADAAFCGRVEFEGALFCDEQCRSGVKAVAPLHAEADPHQHREPADGNADGGQGPGDGGIPGGGGGAGGGLEEPQANANPQQLATWGRYTYALEEGGAGKSVTFLGRLGAEYHVADDMGTHFSISTPDWVTPQKPLFAALAPDADVPPNKRFAWSLQGKQHPHPVHANVFGNERAGEFVVSTELLPVAVDPKQQHMCAFELRPNVSVRPTGKNGLVVDGTFSFVCVAKGELSSAQDRTFLCVAEHDRNDEQCEYEHNGKKETATKVKIVLTALLNRAHRVACHLGGPAAAFGPVATAAVYEEATGATRTDARFVQPGRSASLVCAGEEATRGDDRGRGQVAQRPGPAVAPGRSYSSCAGRRPASGRRSAPARRSDRAPRSARECRVGRDREDAQRDRAPSAHGAAQEP
jgi:hypothetical protein